MPAYTAVLMDHVLGQLPQGAGGLGLNGAVVIHIFEGVVPNVVLALLMVRAVPDVPRIVGVLENGGLGGLGLLHGVEHDTLQGVDIVLGQIVVEHDVVGTHGEAALRLVRAGPVHPHEGVAAVGVGLIGAQEIVAHLPPNGATGHDNGDTSRKTGDQIIDLLAGAVTHVVVGAERNRGFETGVLLLHLRRRDPVGQVGHEANIAALNAHARYAPVIAQNGNLAYAYTHDLLKLSLQDIQVGFILSVVGIIDAFRPKGVKGKAIVALGSVACFCQRPNKSFQFFRGVQFTPLGAVLGVILGGVEVNVHLIFAAKLHEGGAVLYGPGVAVVALDKAAEGHIGVVLHGEVLDLLVRHLLKDALYGGQAVKRRVGVHAHHGHAGGVHCYRVEAGPGGECRVDAHPERNGGAGALAQRHPGLGKGLHGAVLGVLIDPLTIGYLHGGGQRHRAFGVCNAVGRGVDLILTGHVKGVFLPQK